ncbi:MAG TPA: dihydroorotase, partial [Myxococcota bacterium]|nr:dihydroorotase [Myxococcota bacterium]
MRSRIVNCEILDPATGKRFWGFVEWEDGVIRKVGKAGPGLGDGAPEGVQVIDGHGHLLAPSFVDLYAEFCEPGNEHREDIASGSAAAAAGGYTAVLLRPDTDPCVDGADTARFVIELAARADRVDVLPMGCLSRKLGGETMAEIGEMSVAGVRALSDGDRWIAKTGFLRRAMEYGANFGLPIVLTSEDPTMVGGMAHEGLVSAAKGLKTSPVAAEEIAVARHVALAELTGARTHLAKLSSAAGVRLVRDAKARGLPVTASVSIHNLVLDERSVADYDPMCKVWPPARAEEDRQALLAGLADGTIDAVVSDHAPRAIEDKEVEFDLAAQGALSIELVFPLLNRLVLGGELELPVALRA